MTRIVLNAKSLSIFFILNLFSLGASSQDLANTDEILADIRNNFHPKLVENFEVSRLSTNAIKALFNASLEYLYEQIPFATSYLKSGCHIRAHIVGTFLAKNKIKYGLIFAYRKQQKTALEINHKTIKFQYTAVNITPKIKDAVEWRYHVAPFVVANNGEVVIFDHALNHAKASNLSEWILNLMPHNQNDIKYMITSSSYFGMKENLKVVHDNATVKIQGHSFVNRPDGNHVKVDIYISLATPVSAAGLKVKYGFKPQAIPTLSDDEEYIEWQKSEFFPQQEELRTRIIKKNVPAFLSIASFITS